jgi:hypothetical protein
MIASARLKELLHRTPFRPCRICLSDGSNHTVPHPEFAWVFGGRIFAGVPSNGAEGADGLVKELSIPHLARIEKWAPRRPKKVKPH